MTNVARQVETVPENDCDALTDAFAQYQAELLGTLYYLVGNLEDARDTLQETFVKCWRNQDKVTEIHDLKAWIFRVALNTGRDVRKSAWRRKQRALSKDETMIESAKPGPQSEAECNEQMQRLRRAIQDLRSEEQEVFLLRQNGQMKYEEIAAAVGIPLGTVKTRMRLAVAKLRETLAET